MTDPTDDQTKTESRSTENRHGFRVRKSELRVRWEPQEVIPENRLRPAEAKAKMIAETNFPMNRDRAILRIRQAKTQRVVRQPMPIRLRNKKVLRKKDSAIPYRRFGLADGIWDLLIPSGWSELDYHCEVQIDGTKASTARPLKVKRWHVQAIDKNPAELHAQLPFRNQEQAIFNSSFSGRPNDAHHSWAFVAPNARKAVFGEKMRNTYSFTYTGHGCVICGVCGQPYDTSDGDGSDAQYGRWTVCPTNAAHNKPVSTFCVGGWAPCVTDRTKPVSISFFHAADVRNKSVVESSPRYLIFSVACGGGFEPSLFKAFLSRGTLYGVGFRKSTRCDWARDYAKSFFKMWVKNKQCDPMKIRDVFNALEPTWSARLSPRLFTNWVDVLGGAYLRALGRAIADAL